MSILTMLILALFGVRPSHKRRNSRTGRYVKWSKWK